MRTTSRPLLIASVLVSITVLAVLGYFAFTGLSSLSTTTGFTTSDALDITEVSGEVETGNERGYFCDDTGALAPTITTDQGVFPLVDVTATASTSRAITTVDLRSYDPATTWIVLTDGCAPITQVRSFLSDLSPTSAATWSPLWSEPTSRDLASTWFTRVDASGSIVLRSTPLHTYDPARHSSVPSSSLSMFSATDAPMPSEVTVYTIIEDTTITRTRLLLPGGQE